MTTRRPPGGFSIIEVLVVLGIIVLTVAVIGQSLSAIYRVIETSTVTNEAATYAQESLELLTAIKNDFFGCSCGGSCSTCTAPDGQSCSVSEPYTSCWVTYPIGQSGQNRFRLEQSGGSWSLVALSPGSYESVAANPFFSREISITTLSRNAAGDISSSGTADSNTKQVEVTVSWTSRGQTKEVSVSTIFTAWENL